MYANIGEHVYLYESEADAIADEYKINYLLAITFSPRIMGTDTVNEQRTTIVDITSSYSMIISINKKSSIYSSDKKIYLNNEVLTSSLVSDLSYYLTLTFENFTLVRGNPNGKIKRLH